MFGRVLERCAERNVKGQDFDMFMKEDNTYNDIREKSLMQWLDEMEKHEDIAVRGGVRLCRDYIKHLMDENEKLKQENELKNTYLKKMSKRS